MQQILKHYKNYKMPRVILLLLLLLLLLLFREFVTKFHAKVCDEILKQVQQPPDNPWQAGDPFATKGCNMRRTEYAGNHHTPPTTHHQSGALSPYALPLLISALLSYLETENFNAPR